MSNGDTSELRPSTGESSQTFQLDTLKIGRLKVAVNPRRLDDISHLRNDLGGWISEGGVFRHPGESIPSLESILETVGPPQKLITVAGAGWPVIWTRISRGTISNIVTVDINQAQIAYYAKVLNSKSRSGNYISTVLEHHLSGRWPIILDDLTRPSPPLEQAFIRSSFFLSNMADYQSAEEFSRTLGVMARNLEGRNFILFSSQYAAPRQPEGKTKTWQELVSEASGKKLELLTNRNLGLADPENLGKIEEFYVLRLNHPLA